MCLDPGVAKKLDPVGYSIEKTTPKAFAPFSGLHGTSQWFNDKQNPKPRPVSVAPQSASQKLLGE